MLDPKILTGFNEHQDILSVMGSPGRWLTVILADELVGVPDRGIRVRLVLLTTISKNHKSGQ